MKRHPHQHRTAKLWLRLLAAGLCWLATAGGAPAQQLSVVADAIFQPALAELVPAFSERTGADIRLSLGPSTILLDAIFSGTEADVFIPEGERHMRQALEKNLVDATLRRVIVALPNPEPAAEGENIEPRYASAVVMANSTQRVQAMAFLEFLTSETARATFARHGFLLP
ncbi:MAG: ABC transporter substrate-binding protein [Lentisphaerae bacterium]|jgi:ABC-type molybdate transport system substrate-binding protein|nr:ABC transporter substrate-binding protein [Lentisphaerota bacterium]